MRRLAIVSFSFSAAIFAAAYLLPLSFLPLSALLSCTGGLLLFFTRRKWLRPLALGLLGAAVGFGWFYIHDLQTVVPARLLDGSTHETCARVLEYPKVYDSYCRVTVRLENDELPKVDALVYDGSMALAKAEPGDRVRFTAKLSSADKKYGEAYDAYTARDIYLKLNTRSDPVLLEKAPALSTLPLRIQHLLTKRIAALFPADVLTFMKSLMLGDKSDLYRDEGLYLALSRAGNMHALAVSGLHIAFLVGMVQLLLGRNAVSAVICILLSWVFVLITGASPSAVRAAIMQSLLLMAPVLRRENDPPTTLGFALGLILLFNPRAAASISLQLSFSAMAGILCFGNRLYSWFVGGLHSGTLRKLLSGPASAAASALSVLPFTVPLMALHFGYLSLASPLSGVLCYLAISLCFCGGYLACLLSLLPGPAGPLIAWLTAWLARYIAWISGVVADIPYAVLYMELPWCVPWLIATYLLFAAARCLPFKRGEKLLIPAALSVLSMMLLLNLTRIHYEQDDGYFTALSVGQGQCLCAFAGEQTVVIDCGCLMSPDNAGDRAGRFLISRGRDRVDALILTHLDLDHVNGVSLLLEMLPVDRILLPAGAADENGVLPQLQAAANQKKTEIVLLDADAELQLDSLSVSLYVPQEAGNRNDSGLFAALHFGDYDVLVTGDASAQTERAFLKHALPEAYELLVVGHHGSKYASCEELLRSIGADTAVISVGFNSYGHPAEETLERLDANGYNVYRTDRDGTIIMRIEDGYGEKER